MYFDILFSVIFILSIHLSSTANFYGGTVILYPQGSGLQYSALLRTYWVGSTCSQCTNCTDVTTIYNWHTCVVSTGNITSSYTYTGGAWGGGWSGASSWTLFANITTTIHTDNGMYNHPPVTNTIPVLVMQHSCSYDIYITVYDLDGDDIRCRFATESECSTACGKLSGATIDANTCKLSYTPPPFLTGFLPVTVQVEDFYDTSSLTALSSIPLQFIVYAKDFGRTCTALPEIVTPSHNAVYVLAVGSQFDLNVTARSTSTSMSQIEVIRPSGMTVSASTIWSASGYSYMSTIATWTPSSADERAHVFCFMAIESGQSAASKQTCVVLVVSSISSISSTDCGQIQSESVTFGTATLTSGNTTYLSTANVSCNTGYNTSTTHITCQSNGHWSVSICTIKDCGQIQSDSVTSGTSTLTSGNTTYLSTADVSCNTGYNTSITDITCQSTGQWTVAICTLKDCRFPVLSEYVIAIGEVTTYGAVIHFTCTDNDSVIVGNLAIECLDNGSWSSSVPRCKVKYGGFCEESRSCLTEGADCLNGTCVCGNTGIVDLTNNLCDTMPLTGYGHIEDTLVPKDTACSGPVTFPARFTVFAKAFKNVYICSNGYVCLDKLYTDPKPPNDTATFGDFNILAPYYADTDVNTSNVYYRHYDITKNNGEDMANGDVKNIEYFIQSFGGKEDFKAAFILFVTWKEVQPFDSSIGQGTATFQLVLATDGTATFALYIYEHGGMNWTSTLQKPNIWIGYHAARTYSKSSLFSLSRQALTVDGRVFTKGVQGVTLHHLNSPDETPPESVVNRIECYRWYNDNVDTNISIANTLPECPCDLRKLSFDPWFTELEAVPHHSDIACYTVYPSTAFLPHGKNCCYNKTSNLWVQERPYAGSFFLYHPRDPTEQHAAKDIQGKNYCCYGSQLCDKYYELRPVGSCYLFTWFGTGTSWGDPHFRTLDNKDFTFNGLGEYLLVQVPKQEKLFKLQARTTRPRKANGSLSKATIFSAFAAQGGDDANFHVEINQNETGFTIYANRDDISLATRQHNYTYGSRNGSMHIVTRGQTTITVFFPYFGISLNVTVNVRMFSLVVLINSEFQGQTRGLLGNFNENPDDDFVLPNGTMKNANISEREIFDYGSEWRVDASTSVFIYSKGKGHQDYHNASYIPPFIEDAPTDKVEQGKSICSENNIQCIFDFVFTEDEQIAYQTKATDLSSVIDKQEINSKIPSFETCEATSVYLKDEVVCQLSLSDEDNGVIVEGLDEDSFTVFPNKTLIFKIVNTEPIQLRVTVENADGTKSPKKIINLIVCTGCSGSGICSKTEIREVEQETEGFSLATCLCDIGFDGDDCGGDFDGCASKPCSLLRKCTDMTPSEHKQTNTSHRCGPCPDGYSLTPGEKCVDIDECSEGNGGCEQVCTNTEGRFECSCMLGYRIETTNKNICTDINECDEALHQCKHECGNTDGSYGCSCKKGFDLETDGMTCLQNASDVCSGSNINCSAADGCTVDNGEAQCFCNNGFDLTDDTSCEDIDECSGSVCPQGCENTDGSFTCKCFTGYSLSDKTTCTACEFPKWGEDCSNSCDCPDAIRCDPVKGCVCRPGFTGIQCDTDIKECEADVDLCQDVRKTCVDTEGSYLCDCIHGYQIDGDKKCKDIDECSNSLLNDCDQICGNVIGNYTCDCKEGYNKHNGTHCKDIDECILQTAECDHICENYEGGFNCYCEFGYILTDDRRTCVEDENPCETANITCDVCVTDINTHTLSCGCKPGYRLGVDGSTCLDLQECADIELNKCKGNAVCVNERGSYRCECHIGYKLQNDMRTCSVCDEFHYGVDCSEICNCLKGTCDKERGCICDEGWLGVDCDKDKNECQSTQNLCVGENVRCENTLGSYKCQCETGFHDINGICQDKDECNQTDTNDCDQICENTFGDFRCLCQKGFILHNKTCTDIDECVTQNNCEQKCDNSVGSYRCFCRNGYNLDLNNRKSCTPVVECNETLIKSCKEIHADCVILEGDPTCNCWKGFQFNNGTSNCEDTNECLDNPCTQECENIQGGYNCTCVAGFEIDIDQVTCKGCDEGLSGEGCGVECVCNKDNTLSCNATDGSCACSAGWTGAICESNVEECLDVSLSNCTDNSECVDTDGSFLCNCFVGYQKTGTGVCEVCQNFYYGQECELNCSCVITNSVACNHTDGFCDCKQGWDSQDCSVDINECEINLQICADKPNTTCENYPGAYICECNDGFYSQDGLCLDEDECQEDNDGCIQDCENTEGDFMCNCFDGFRGDGLTCTECEDNTYGYNCSKNCSCNTTHSDNPEQSCDTESGVCSCRSEWTGPNCNVDVNECTNEDLCAHIKFSDCHNLDGGYSCECLRGFSKNANSECVPDSITSTAPPASQFIQVSIMIVLAIELPSGTNLNVTATFNYYAAGVIDALTLFYQQVAANLGEFTIIITSLSSGSLVANYTLVYSREGDTAEKLKSATVSLAEGANLVFYNQNVSSKMVLEGNTTDRCDIYQSVFGECEPGFKCAVEYDEPICKEDVVADQFGLIIGVSTGVFVVCVSLITLVLCMRMMREKRELKKRQAAMNKYKVDEDPTEREPSIDYFIAATNHTYNGLDASIFDISESASTSQDVSNLNPGRSWKSTTKGFLRKKTEANSNFRRETGRHKHPK